MAPCAIIFPVYVYIMRLKFSRLCAAVLQTHFPKRGKGLVNCVYKPCPTGMQLAGWRNQISNNALLNYLLQSKHAPWKLFSKCFHGCCSSGKDVALFRCFQDCYCYSNNDVMCHVTKYCNMIGPHCTVRRDKACIRSSPDPSLSCGSWSALRDYAAVWIVVLSFFLISVFST